MAPEKDVKKEWEELWKRFAEVLSFLYDNENVISSLKNQGKLPTHKDAKKIINNQIHEIDSLIDHHVEDLVSMTEKAAILAKKKGKTIDKECSALSKAIKTLDIEEIQDKIKALKASIKM